SLYSELTFLAEDIEDRRPFICYYLVLRHDKSSRGNHRCYLIIVEEGNHTIDQAKSKKFKNMRSKQVFPYTGSRRGYARLENDMVINVLRGNL
ncbi:hypothetical protein GIB67_022499, partial [Kingdonia uniflora]